MKAAEKLFEKLDKVAFVLAAVSVGGMLGCVFLQVIARTFQLPIPWTTELSQYFFLWSTTFASYVAARRGKLIGVELLQNKMPSPIARAMKFVSQGSAAFFYGLVIYYCAVQLPNIMAQTTPILKWSMGMIYIIMMIGLLLLSLYFAYLAILGLAKGKPEAVPKKTAAEIAEEVE